jgi:hypothetical protein
MVFFYKLTRHGEPLAPCSDTLSDSPWWLSLSKPPRQVDSPPGISIGRSDTLSDLPWWLRPIAMKRDILI